jgi:hypothetical protein
VNGNGQQREKKSNIRLLPPASPVTHLILTVMASLSLMVFEMDSFVRIKVAMLTGI